MTVQYSNVLRTTAGPEQGQEPRAVTGCPRGLHLETGGHGISSALAGSLGDPRGAAYWTDSRPCNTPPPLCLGGQGVSRNGPIRVVWTDYGVDIAASIETNLGGMGGVCAQGRSNRTQIRAVEAALVVKVGRNGGTSGQRRLSMQCKLGRSCGRKRRGKWAQQGGMDRLWSGHCSKH